MNPKLDPTPRLLASQEPVVRYRTLVDVLRRPPDDAAVVAARAAAAESPIVASIMARRNRKGLWGTEADYYLPKHNGTFWTFCTLAELGLTAADESIRHVCDYMLAHQGSDGAFRRAHTSGGQPEDVPMPCTHARITRALVQLGLGSDSRTRRAMDWLLKTQRKDGGWLCGRTPRRHSCLRATIDYLRLAALDADLAAQPATATAAELVYNLLLEPGMGRYRASDSWDVFTYPEVGYSLLGALDALTRLGYGLDRPKMAAAVQAIIAKQQPEGFWRMDAAVRQPPADFGCAGEANAWVTLEAMRVLTQILS